MHPRLLTWFNDVDKDDAPLVGASGVKLGILAQLGLPIPAGFILTSEAQMLFLRQNHLEQKIKQHVENLNIHDPLALMDQSEAIIKLIRATPFPSDLGQQIIEHCTALQKKSLQKNQSMIARFKSSNFKVSVSGQNGQGRTVVGETNAVEEVRKIWASIFEPSSLFHLLLHDKDPLEVHNPLIVLEALTADTYGTISSADPLTQAKDRLTIDVTTSLNAVSDHIVLKKSDLSLIQHGKTALLTNEQTEELAKHAIAIEKHFYFPHVTEFSIIKNKIIITKTKPLTNFIEPTPAKKVTCGDDPEPKATEVRSTDEEEMIVRGEAGSHGLATGAVTIIAHSKDIYRFPRGGVLVAKHLDYLFEEAIRKAAAIIIEEGDHDSYAVKLAQKLGIPSVINARDATNLLYDGMTICVNGTLGKITHPAQKAERVVLAAKRPEVQAGNNIDPLVQTATKVYIDLKNYKDIDLVSLTNADGVGVLHIDSIMSQLGSHPKKIIATRTQKVFIDDLANRINTIAQAMYPKPVICKLTSFESKDYRTLNGGDAYESDEDNSLIGFRGVARHLVQPDMLQMEIEAILKVRNKLGSKNLSIMIPFCRNVRELEQIKVLLSSWALHRSPSLKFWLSCDVPANIFELKELIGVGIDGVAINADSLAQLMLGLDKENVNVAHKFDIGLEILRQSYAQIIKTCHQLGVPSSIYGHAIADSTDLLMKLVSLGISSVSAYPNHISQVREIIAEGESQLFKQSK